MDDTIFNEWCNINLYFKKEDLIPGNFLELSYSIKDKEIIYLNYDTTPSIYNTNIDYKLQYEKIFIIINLY